MMSTLETILMLLLVIDAIALAVLVLLQQGKGADVGAAFGSGGSGTMFGSAGSASFFAKVTAWLAVGFFVIAFGLAYTAKERAAAIGSLGIDLLDTNADAVPDLGDGADAVDAVAGDGADATVVTDLAEQGLTGDDAGAGASDAPTSESDVPAVDMSGSDGASDEKNTSESLTPEVDSVDSHTPAE
jgi:protein translocase SecG subunit